MSMCSALAARPISLLPRENKLVQDVTSCIYISLRKKTIRIIITFICNLNSLVNKQKMLQEMENDYSSDPGWEDGPDDYEHLPEPDLNNAEVESEVDSADEWGNPDDEGIDMATPIDLDFYPDPVVNYKAKDFVQETTRLNMNRSQKVGMWAYNKRHHPELAEDMKSYDTLERRVRRHLPMPTVSWKVQHVETRKYYSSSGTKFPEKLYGNRDKYDVLIVWARIDVKDLIRFHAGLHSDSCSFVVNGRIDYSQVHLTFTIDGVPLAKSSPDNLHLMAVRFKGCRMVYILQARVAKKAAGKDVHDFLDSFVGECARLQVHVDYFLADAPMRSFAKVMKGHAGRYSCEVCEAAGVCLKRRICYPSSQASKRHRTRERWLECVADLNEQRSGGNNADVRGIMGESPLLKLPHSFDIVKHCPTDPMHRDWLGLMKSTLWRRTVAISKTGHVSVRGQRIVSMVSDHYKSVQLPSEVSHRSRPIDYPNFKAHEWKALLVTSFHVICDAARREVSHRLARVWAKFAFLSFLYYGPGDVQGTFTDPYLTELHNQLYMDFEQEFGEEACSYNVHTYCHMPVVRKLGRPSAVSTEPFEAAYGFAQVSFAPGTRNISLQICRNMLLRNLAHEQRMGHCQRRLTIERESPSVRCDDSILIDEFLNYYKVIETTRREVQVARIRTVPWTSPDEPDLPFYQVGVCVLDFIEDTTVTRPREWFKGKGVHLADNVLVPFFWDMLFS